MTLIPKLYQLGLSIGPKEEVLLKNLPNRLIQIAESDPANLKSKLYATILRDVGSVVFNSVSKSRQILSGNAPVIIIPSPEGYKILRGESSIVAPYISPFENREDLNEPYASVSPIGLELKLASGKQIVLTYPQLSIQSPATLSIELTETSQFIAYPVTRQ